MKTFGETLKKLRKSRTGLRQEDLANKLNLSRSQVNNYENGFSEPDITTLVRLAAFFDVSLDVLVGRVDAPNDEALHNTLSEIQTTYAALNEFQRELFCKQITSYAKYIAKNDDLLR